MKEQLLNEVENIVANEEIVHHEQFLLLPQCFQLHSIIVLSFIEVSYFELNLRRQKAFICDP